MPNVSPRGMWVNVGGTLKTMTRGFVGTPSGEAVEIDRVWRRENGEWEIVWARSIESPSAATATYTAGDPGSVKITWTVPADSFATEAEIRRADGSLAGYATFTDGEFVDNLPRPVNGPYTVRGKLGTELSTTARSTNSLELNVNVSNLSWASLDPGQEIQRLRIVWSLPTNRPDKWRVYRWLLDGGTIKYDYVTELAGTATEYISSEAALAGRRSQWIFVAVIGGQTAPIDVGNINTRPGVLTAMHARPPRNLAVFPFGSSSVRVYWDAPPGTLASYWLTTFPNSVTYTVPANATDWIVPAGGPSSTTVALVAVGAYGNSSYVEKTITSAAVELPAPTNPVAAPTSTLGELRFTWWGPQSWPDPVAPVSFQIQGSDDGVVWYDTDEVPGGVPYVSYYTFQGTSGWRWMRVRSKQNGNVSLWASHYATPLWDVAAPNPATVSSFKPEGSYGRLVVRGATPSTESTRYEVQYRVNGGSPVTVYEQKTLVPASTSIVKPVYIGAANDIVSVRINVYDAANNIRYGSWFDYTLVPSPISIAATWSRSWRGTSGGEWDARDDKDVYQGSAADSGGQYRGCWGYANKLQSFFSASSTIAQTKTVLSATIFIHRRGCGINQADALNLGVHAEPADPGDGLDSSPPTITANAVTAEKVVFEQEREVALTAAQIAALAAGTSKGVGTYPVTSPYLCLYGVDDDPDSGRITISHLG